MAVVIYVLADGFDLGVGILFLVAPRDADRDTMMESVEPVWDGNETWLVFGGTLLWAAFPAAYYILLPAFYLPISGWTALTEPAVAVRWFAWPNLVLLAPVPIVTAVVVLALWRSLWGASETLTFRLAALLFLLGFAGLVVSLWPYIVPRHITIWGGAADPQTLWFAGVGIVIITPIVLAYQVHAYWVFRGKTVVDRAEDERHPAIQARRTSSQVSGLHLS